MSSSVHKLAVSPELLVTGHAGEILVKAMGSRLAGQDTYKNTVPSTITPRSISWACYWLDWSLWCCYHRACQFSSWDAGIFRQILYSLPSWNSALPFWFRYFCPRGRDLDLDCNASWMFWILISFKIQAGVFLGFADLEKYAYASILMIGHRRFAVKQTMDFIHARFTLTACTVSHLWIRLVPSPTTAQLESEQAVHISDDSCDIDKGINAALNPLHELVVLSQPFLKAAEVSTSESEWSDGFRE